MITKQVEREILANLIETEFRPRMKELSKRIGRPYATVYDAYTKMEKRGQIRITIEILEYEPVWKRVGEQKIPTPNGKWKRRKKRDEV